MIPTMADPAAMASMIDGKFVPNIFAWSVSVGSSGNIATHFYVSSAEEVSQVVRGSPLLDVLGIHCTAHRGEWAVEDRQQVREWSFQA